MKNPNGPFPGDEAIFSFNLYSDAALTHRVGAAVFTCQYNLDANTFCDASFRLTNRGTLIAAGVFNFNAKRFTLAVTGGYHGFATQKGSIAEVPSANHSQKLSIVCMTSPHRPHMTAPTRPDRGTI